MTVNEDKFPKKTKIIATIGPACNSEVVLEQLFQQGTDLIRINASHVSDPKDIINSVELVRSVSRKLNKFIGIILDLQGPKLRLGEFEAGAIHLEAGQQFTLTSEQIIGTETRASVSYEHFVDDVQIGESIFIDDGRVKLKALSKEGKNLLCEVLIGGKLSDHKGINLPHTVLSISAVTEKDKNDCLAAVQANVDYIALSFVSSADDIQMLREHLQSIGGHDVMIISKIERQLAIDNIKDILEETDCVMVARGDLGVEIGLEHVPKLQKMIIRKANRRVRPVIVATQMLESMINSETATRAEVSDVANAIYDRCDAVMLSGETAVGKYPVKTVKTMATICRASDLHLETIKKEDGIKRDMFIASSRATSFCKAADQIGEENHANLIMVFSSSGTTPLIASKLNPSFPIISPTDTDKVCYRMSLYRGVIPIKMPKPFNEIHRWRDMIELSTGQAKGLGYLAVGDVIVVTAGIPIGVSGGINSIRLLTVT